MLARRLITCLSLVTLAACGDETVVETSSAARRAPTATAAGPDAGEVDTTGGADTATMAATDSASADDADAHDDATAPTTPEPPPAPLISPARLEAVAEAIQAARVGSALSGHTFGGFVLDLDTDTVVFASGADRMMIPASNTKILTSAAAIALLGEDHRFVTRVLAGGEIDANGVLAGSLHLHGGHDFTWSRWFYASARVPLDALADRLWELGLRRVAGTLELWGAWSYDGHHFGVYSPTSHRTRAAVAARAALVARGIAVDGATVERATMDVPDGAERAVESLPLHVALWPINRKSHNEMADTLMRHIGWVRDGTSEYATGAAAALAWASDAGVEGLEAAVIGDGSGLDTANRLSARQLVAMYRAILARPEGAAWLTSLSIAGAGGPASNNSAGDAVVTAQVSPYMGTLAGRMEGPDTAGRVFGKSGTNAGITTTGVLYNGYDGHRYAFAFQMNGITSGQYPAARAAQDAMVAAFAGDLLEAGARPAAPVLERVVGRADGSVAVHWGAVDGVAGVDGVDGYFVYPSADGRVFDRSERVHVLGTAHVFAAIPGARTVYVRVSAVNAAGESAASDVMAARVDPQAGRVLLVDGNDRWQRQPADENPMGAPHGFVVAYAEALTAVGFDSAANDAVVGGAVTLADYEAVLWDVGEESWADETFDATEQALVAAYLENGGRLLVAGAEIAWDLDARGYGGATAADVGFLQGWLRAGYAGDDADVFVAEPVPGGVFEGMGPIGFYTPGAMFVAYPELLQPLGGAEAALVYPTWAGATGVAAVTYAGDYRLVHIGFPLAAVGGASERVELLNRVLLFFGL